MTTLAGHPFALAMLLLCARSAVAPNTHHLTEAIWGQLKRCDMMKAKRLPSGVKGAYNHAWDIYTEGEWVPASSTRHSVTMTLPLSCEATNYCPLGTCSDGVARASDVCTRYYQTCYSDRMGHTFKQNVHNLQFVWQPVDGCYFSPLSAASSIPQWQDWARGLESGPSSPMLWVGDGLLAEFFSAFQHLTGGATQSDFHRSDVLVNGWTLGPMSATEVSSCESSLAAGGPPLSGSLDVPCPPSGRSEIWWEDNEHHRISHLKWVQTFEARAATLKTLVLGMGRFASACAC